MIRTLEWTDDGIVMIDQRLLPSEEAYLTFKTAEEVADAIRNMVVRGAPAIGVAAAMGIALGVQQIPSKDDVEQRFADICAEIQNTRPTARNLFWAVERMKKAFEKNRGKSLEEMKSALKNEAQQIYCEDIEINRRLGEQGQTLLGPQQTVLTHCNAGALATAGYGTALGVIRAAVAKGKKIHVFADETRPFLQGSRLTAWEMVQENIPCTLITDNMAGHFMKSGAIQAVIVGADRIARNGDTANKIGTYSVAVLAREHGIPFYVAAPLSTIDLETPSGEFIPIEERSRAEVTEILGKPVAPASVEVANPAFDVTPARLITAIITEAGIARPDYRETLPRLF
ncbi:MAG: S-methyl-5-thioribose-1-phosphate isomerase [Acidobacteria bacterium]|nr:S-methyl-5-thioribose-1-phosphate isomerase [Acidobacteriota bacterium]